MASVTRTEVRGWPEGRDDAVAALAATRSLNVGLVTLVLYWRSAWVQIHGSREYGDTSIAGRVVQGTV
jgi:hypothetical protein